MKRIHKEAQRQHRHARIRAKISGTAKRPRISVFKSNRNIFIQAIDDTAGKTLASNTVISRAKSKTKVHGTKTDVAGKAGEALAVKLKSAGIASAVFDKGGYKYHGRIKAVAEGLRRGGITI